MLVRIGGRVGVCMSVLLVDKEQASSGGGQVAQGGLEVGGGRAGVAVGDRGAVDLDHRHELAGRAGQEGLVGGGQVLGAEDALQDLEAERWGQLAQDGPGDAGQDAQVQRRRAQGLAGAPPQVGRRGLQQLAAQPDQDGVVGPAGPG
ncbi:MAG TPA: hypothetical protein VG499_09205, partial [Actinomycetota bacterium]|nr:hypothetical protein [Actinomycetota bacterium]